MFYENYSELISLTSQKLQKKSIEREINHHK